jgi:Bardet-Biedl syndrome 2 protein
MLVTAYNFTLNHSLPQNLVTINKFDGKTPSLACSTTGGKVLVHTPHSKDNADPILGMKGKDVQYLNVNKDIVCLTGGRLDNNVDRDMLMIGSKTNLLVYDINENSDVFDKEVQDGISCMTFAKDLNPDYPLIITGGNLSLTGFDSSSEEQFWTVTGDVANSIEILDFDMDGQKELVVGSDDYSIRVYKNEEMIFDISEESKVQFLSKIERTAFAYALNNGTIGTYAGSAQRWNSRAENRISALLGIDFDMDGSKQIMVGYQSGKFEIRKSTDGEVTFKSNMGSTISKIMYEDYRMEGEILRYA